MEIDSQLSLRFVSILCILSIFHPLPVTTLPISVSAEADCVIAGSENVPPRVKRTAFTKDVSKKWPNNTVYYEIDEELSSFEESIKNAMDMIQNVSCIRFIGRTNEIDYIRFQLDKTMCQVPIGRQGGAQITRVNIAQCGYFGFFIHASMHALGFEHEHLRMDRNNYINIYWENIQLPEYLKPETLSTSSEIQNSTYDVESIMHTGSFTFSKNAKPTILTKSGGLIQSYEEKAKLSELDILAINNYYNCPGSS